MIDALKWRYRLAEARSLLEAERMIILRGALSDMVKLDSRRQRVEGYLSEMPENLSDQMKSSIEDIGRQARNNQRLLKAYLEGARSAASRLTKIAEVERSVGAYRQDGSRIEAPRLKQSQQKQKF